jgi:hypothetical protein
MWQIWPTVVKPLGMSWISVGKVAVRISSDVR